MKLLDFLRGERKKSASVAKEPDDIPLAEWHRVGQRPRDVSQHRGAASGAPASDEAILWVSFLT